MTTATVGYEPVYAWVKQVVGQTHRMVGRTVAWAVLCIVVAQRVTPAALARALPHEQAGSGRSCLRRIRRWWQGPALVPRTGITQRVEEVVADRISRAVSFWCRSTRWVWDVD
jgi:hypothetical protein